MRSVLLILVWPHAVWRCLREDPLPAGRLMLRLLLPFSIVCTGALYFALSRYEAQWQNQPLAADYPLLGATGVPVLFATGLGGTLAMAIVFMVFAPACNGRCDFTRSLNLAFFGMAPAWLASFAIVLMPASVLYPFAAAWSAYLLFAGARILLKVDDQRGGEFLLGSIATLTVASGLWGLVLGSFVASG